MQKTEHWVGYGAVVRTRTEDIVAPRVLYALRAQFPDGGGETAGQVDQIMVDLSDEALRVGDELTLRLDDGRAVDLTVVASTRGCVEVRALSELRRAT